MMRPLALLAALAAAAPALAAESIGGQNEKPLVLTGKVVDVLCELTGRCATGCGGGRRQLGIRQADGKLVPVIKGPENFAGPQADLAPLCGRTVTLDGLLFESNRMPIYQVQGIRIDPAAAGFTPADRFLKEWTAKHGPAEEWFRNDPLVKEVIGRNGVLGKPGLAPKPQ